MVINPKAFVLNCLQKGRQKYISIDIKLHLLIFEQSFRLWVVVLNGDVDSLSCKRGNGWPLVAIILMSFYRITWSKTVVQRTVKLAKTVVNVRLESETVREWAIQRGWEVVQVVLVVVVVQFYDRIERVIQHELVVKFHWWREF